MTLETSLLLGIFGAVLAIAIMVFDIFKKGNISKAVAGESIGSLIS